MITQNMDLTEEKPMDKNLEKGFEIVLADAIQKHGSKPDALIPILSEVNKAFGYIPSLVIREIHKRLHLTESQIYSVASFYDMLSTEPRGRHVIKFCESAPCHVVGSKLVWNKLSEKLNLQNGETSPDNKWTLVTTSCVGLCSVAPVLVVDGDLYGNVTPEQVTEILARYE